MMIDFSGLMGSTYKRKFEWPNAESFFKGVAISIGTGLLIVACSQRAEESRVQKRSGSGNVQTEVSKDNANSVPSITGSSGNLPLRTLSDVPLTGGATRLDYQSLDSDNGRLYIAHLGSDHTSNHRSCACRRLSGRSCVCEQGEQDVRLRSARQNGHGY